MCTITFLFMSKMSNPYFSVFKDDWLSTRRTKQVYFFILLSDNIVCIYSIIITIESN